MKTKLLLFSVVVSLFVLTIPAQRVFAVSTEYFAGGIWNASGNVGIGTASPNNKLEINAGTFAYGTAVQDAIRLAPTLSGGNSGNPTSLGSIYWFDPNGSGAGARINAVADKLSTNPHTHLEFWTNNGTGALAERVRIDNQGYVGIATTSPAYALDVAGAASFENNYIHNVAAPTAASDVATKSYVDTAVSGVASSQWTTGSGLIYYNGGNVGIGTTAPNSTLQVNGNIYAAGSPTGANNYNFQAGSVGVSTLYGYTAICTGNSTGACSSTNGVVLGLANSSAGVNIPNSGNVFFNNGGNVGIGTTAPGASLEIAKNNYPTLRINDTSAANRQWDLTASKSNFGDFEISNYVGTKLDINSSGNVGIGTIAPAYTLDVHGTANITGKLTVGTVDPVYFINGANYATYGASMTGVNEETAGTVTLGEHGADGAYAKTINFGAQAQGSDLWLFAHATDLKENLSSLVAILTPSFNGNVWYTKDAAADTITIHSTQAGEVSYRFTAPRFDANQWGNAAPASETANFTVK